MISNTVDDTVHYTIYGLKNVTYVLVIFLLAILAR